MPNSWSSQVPESALDHGKILSRGGGNVGDEDFCLLKCLMCERLTLFESEADTLCPDPFDLGRRVYPLVGSPLPPACPQCYGPLVYGVGPHRPGTPGTASVSWSELAASPWSWVVRNDSWPPGSFP